MTIGAIEGWTADGFENVGWADPDTEFGFGYVMSRMDMGLAGDKRSSRLINACYDAVA